MQDKAVLVVEDDAFLGDTLCLALEEHGVSVRLARDGEEAVAMLDQAQPDLLLLDLVMPKKDGLAVLKHVRERGYAFPVVVLSNLSADMDAQRCQELGVSDYLVKSNIDEDQLWPKLHKYL
jgi:two-component system response regulator VicR